MPIPSIPLGKAFGVDVVVHWTFLFLPPLIIWYALRLGESPGIVALRLVLVVLVVFSVLVHEMGHVLAARALNIPTRRILLTPLCGLAVLERSPATPRGEVFVALSGPVANGMVAGLAALVGWIAGTSMEMTERVLDLHLLTAVFWINVALFLLNLVPLFPMDGGRILRALLCRVLSPPEATRLAARIGQVGGVALLVAGFWAPNLALAAIGVFLVIAAEHEVP